MKVYHGSSIRDLKELTATNSDEENFEGKAVYLTDSMEVAKEYSTDPTDPTGALGSVYEVMLSDPILDLSSKAHIDHFISKALDPLGIDWVSLEWTQAATTHLESHSGKNGIWCLDQDVASIFKFEPRYKKDPDLAQLQSEVLMAIQRAVNSHSIFKIRDSDNKCFMYIVKNQAVSVLKEHRF
jgi:hypothetical protein